MKVLPRMFVVLAIAMATLGFSRSAMADAKEVKLGTLAPKDSAWGKVFGAWAKAVEEESSGSLKLTWFYNGSQGDELAMVGKMRSKQLDGAAITATGLAQVWPHIVALQMPGLFPSWAKLDAAREKMAPTFKTEFEKQGFVILGTGDVGAAHLMSRGVAIRTPDDLKKAHPFYISGDNIGQKFLETVGVPAPKALSVPAILPAVSARGEGSIDVINSPSIAAEQLGWAPHMDHVNENISGFGIGALVMQKEAFEGLGADAKAVLARTGKNTGQLLTQRIRGIDGAAFDRFKANKTVVKLNATEEAAWAAIFSKVRASLKAEGKVRGDIFDQVVAAAQ
ncbi:MAG: TRAP transporter substrate-binding protein DctP [Labilithrix sp.]|nr:TRAP transporter substrate-binding protein DctP [Labilithrix sp.]MCW5815100.1 TRAP transporter substrate-binding protein DctP [Labilithrix sp.]